MEFVFVDAEYYHKSDTGIFPAECAFVKVTLEKGVIGKLCVLLKPDDVPVGLGSALLTRSKNYHQMDTIHFECSAVSYHDAFKEIMKFLNHDVAPWLLVDNNEDKGGNRDKGLGDILSALDKINKASGGSVTFQLIDVHLMMYRAQRFMGFLGGAVSDGRGFENVDDAKVKLDSFLSDTEQDDTGCAFHHGKDASRHCCLQKAIRLANAFLKYCS